MRIGELAKRSGLAPSRIRFYEASGLIGPVERKANGYRDYPQNALLVLEIITGAQAAGFSLEEIRQLLPLPAGGWQHDALLDSLQRKVAEIEALQERLKHNKARLLVAIEGIRSKPQDVPCMDNSQRVLECLHREADAGRHRAGEK